MKRECTFSQFLYEFYIWAFSSESKEAVLEIYAQQLI